MFVCPLIRKWTAHGPKIAKNGPKLAVLDFAERVSQKLTGQFPPTQVYLKRLDVYLCTGVFIYPLTRKSKAAHGPKWFEISGLGLCGTRISETTGPISTNSSLFEASGCLVVHWRVYMPIDP